VFDEVIVCLDGSSLAEKIIPLARGLTQATAGKLIFLRVVQDPAEIWGEEEYLTDCARQYGAQLRLAVSLDPARAIRAELDREPRAIAALTTHGRTAWAEAIMGSMALRVLREAMRPVLLFRPREEDCEAPGKITTVAAALDGSAFSEKIVSYAVRAARSLSARLVLLQALPVVRPGPVLSHGEKADIVESAYLHRKAVEIQAAQGIEVQWEVLHGEPDDALCRYLKDMPETLLAMTTHARGGAERVVLGSVAGFCVRHAGVPLLLYWPPHRSD
jgi:nucleotide-binding universal stress UspA family protein